MHLSELKAKHVSELVDLANAMEIDGANRLRKQELIFALLKNQAKKGETIFGDGVLEILPAQLAQALRVRLPTVPGPAAGPAQSAPRPAISWA